MYAALLIPRMQAHDIPPGDDLGEGIPFPTLSECRALVAGAGGLAAAAAICELLICGNGASQEELLDKAKDNQARLERFQDIGWSETLRRTYVRLNHVLQGVRRRPN